MKTLVLSFTLLAAACIASLQAQTIGTFGTGQYNVTYSDFTVSQTGTTTRIQGVDSGSMLLGDLGASQHLAFTPTQLLLAGSLATSNPNTVFEIVLVDDLGYQLSYTGNWSFFTTLGQSYTVALNLSSSDSSFDGTVTSVGLRTGGIDNNPIDFTFKQLDAVPAPEPGANALMLLGAVVLGGKLSARFRKHLLSKTRMWLE